MKYFEYLKKHHPEILKQISSKAGKSVKYETRLKAYRGYKKWESALSKEERYKLRKKKGLTTQKKHPTLSSETLKKTHIKLRMEKPKEYSQRQSEAGKKGGKIRARQLESNKEYFSRMGKITQQRHPHLTSEIIKKAHEEWRKNDLEGYSLRQSKAMLSIKRPTKPEKIMRQMLPSDFIFDNPFKFGVPDFRSIERKIIIQVDGPRHYQTMGPAYDNNRLEKTKFKDKKQMEEWGKLGYKVYSFKDFDIIKKSEEVKSRLKDILKET